MFAGICVVSAVGAVAGPFKGSAPVRFYSFNGAGDRTVRVSSATPGAFTLYVFDGYAPIECVDSKKQVKKYEKWIAKAKKRLREAIPDDAPANVVNPLKRYLKNLRKHRKDEIEYRDEVCSYV